MSLISNYNTEAINTILKHSEKYDKHGNASLKLKDIFNHYEKIGFSQVLDKHEKIISLYKLRYGIIDEQDFIKVNRKIESLSIEDEPEINFDLKTYPIASIIVNGIMGEYEKKLADYSVKAINPENTNEILEKLSNDLRQSLIKRAEGIFNSQNPDANEEQRKQFYESKKIKDFYAKDFRTELELWAEHILRIEDDKFNMKSIELDLLEQIITTENPILAVNLYKDYYKPEVIPEEDAFCIKSIKSKDYSDGTMFGWFVEPDNASILRKYSAELSAKDYEKLSSWFTTPNKSSFVTNGQYDFITGNNTGSQESMQNSLAFDNLMKDTTRFDYKSQSNNIKETHIYFQLPRKKGYLTVIEDNNMFHDTVSELFKASILPIYEEGKPRKKEYLISGEHVDWYYDNEVYYGIKLSFNENQHSLADDKHSIWVKLCKSPVQIPSDIGYGSIIPVHGGEVSKLYNQTISLISKVKPWQIFYDWSINRAMQMAKTEIGKFLLLNSNALPDESLDGSWDNEAMFKFLTSIRDTTIGNVDTSLNNLGGSNLQLGGGVAQTIDASKNEEIQAKLQIAGAIKNECFNIVGMTGDYLLGNVQARQTATSVRNGNQRSSTQIQHLFTRLSDVLKKGRTTMLETAKYLESKGDTSKLSYNSRENSREIFSIPSSKLSLGKFDIYVKSNVRDIDVMETIKSYALQNNTLGIDAYEFGLIQNSKSTDNLLSKLFNLRTEKQEEDKQQYKSQQEQQQKMIEANEKALEMKLQQEALENEKDREATLLGKEISSYGYANSPIEDIKAAIQQATDNNFKSRQIGIKEDELAYKKLTGNKNDDDKKLLSQRNQDFTEKKEMRKISQKDEELRLREKDIDARNKRTKKLD